MQDSIHLKILQYDRHHPAHHTGAASVEQQAFRTITAPKAPFRETHKGARLQGAFLFIWFTVPQAYTSRLKWPTSPRNWLQACNSQKPGTYRSMRALKKDGLVLLSALVTESSSSFSRPTVI